MSIVAYGVGRDIDVVGGYAAFGFGILEFFPEGITSLIADIVYKEIRILNVRGEGRSCEIEYNNRNLQIDLED